MATTASRSPSRRYDPGQLTAREIAVASKLARGYAVSRIALECNTTEWDVETNIASIAKVLGIAADADPHTVIGAWYRGQVRLFDAQVIPMHLVGRP